MRCRWTNFSEHVWVCAQRPVRWNRPAGALAGASRRLSVGKPVATRAQLSARPYGSYWAPTDTAHARCWRAWWHCRTPERTGTATGISAAARRRPVRDGGCSKDRALSNRGVHCQSPLYVRRGVQGWRALQRRDYQECGEESNCLLVYLLNK